MISSLSELDKLSPNERARYIEEQLSTKRVQRIVEARRQFSQHCVGQLIDYKQQKEEYNERHKKQKLTKEEKQERIAQINVLKARLEEMKQCHGMGQAIAKDMNQAAEQQKFMDQKLAQSRKEEEQHRFKEAISLVRSNDPNIAKQQRTQQLVSAREQALSYQDGKKHQYKAKIREDQQRERKQALEESRQLHSQQHPKLSLDDYAKTFYHAGIGTIPVTHAGQEYEKQLDNQVDDDVELKKRLAAKKRLRSAQAARIEEVTQNKQRLINELEHIHQYEINEALEEIQHAKAELPIDQLYNIKERNERYQTRMDAYLIVDDDAPVPRATAPQPQPMIKLPSSPTSSDEY